jgi:nucleotide-binding universal stress UspA family protein
LARGAGAQLSLVQASEHTDAASDSARIDLQSAIDELRQGGMHDVDAHVVEGEPADAILETAEATHADLVVMSTHGRGGLGRWLYGSVADEVLRHSSVPVLLVPAACTQTWPVDGPVRVLVPLDGSSLAAEALQPACALAETLDGEVLLLAVVEPPMVMPDGYLERSIDLQKREQARLAGYLNRVADELRTAAPSLGVGTRVFRGVVGGGAADMICAVAQEVGASAIAMATHGQGGLARLWLGSVATRTIQHATVPVLVYRPAAVRPTQRQRQVEPATETSPAGAPVASIVRR